MARISSKSPLVVFAIALFGFIVLVRASIASAYQHLDWIPNYVGEQTQNVVFGATVPSSIFRSVIVPSGGADVDIFLRDCCIRDDVIEVYVDDCLVARVDSQGGAFGTHPGETHTISLAEGTHTVEYRNVFS